MGYILGYAVGFAVPYSMIIGLANFIYGRACKLRGQSASFSTLKAMLISFIVVALWIFLTGKPERAVEIAFLGIAIILNLLAIVFWLWRKIYTR